MAVRLSRILRPIFLVASSSSLGRSMSSQAGDCIAPDEWASYKVLANQKISPNTNILRVATPSGRPILGWDPNIPTCISVKATDPFDPSKSLSKSYSPISHPSTKDEFSLLVKAYEPVPGGGVGHYLCGLATGDSFTAKVKSSRVMHGDTAVLKRGWKHVAFIGGGTGVAPLYQLVLLFLQDEAVETLSFLNIHSKAQDVLLENELQILVEQYPTRFKVTTVLTQQDLSSRGTVDLIRKTLPAPEESVMIFVCGKDGFVDYWGGPVARADPPPGKKKGPKIQGPLLGLLRDAGYNASQVFKY